MRLTVRLDPSWFCFVQVLNVHLLRYTYNPVNFQKDKLKDSIVIPDVVDFGEVLGVAGEKEDVVYELVGVLEHKGTSAYSGHYVATLRSWSSPSVREGWWLFDDDNVTAVAPPGSPVAEASGVPGKSPTC